MKFLQVFFLATLVSVSLTAQNQSGTFVNGVNGSASVPYNPNLFAPGGLTIEAWVRYDGSTLGSQNRFPTIVRANNAANWSYHIRVNANANNTRQIRFAVRTTSAGVAIVNWDFSPGDLLCWTHVAATYDGVISRVFINGSEVAQTISLGGPIVDNGGVFGIGEGLRNATLHNEVWNGDLDNVRIWSVALTEAQIQSQMFATLVSGVGLEASWLLDGDFVDATGNGNDGTVFGSVAFNATTLPTQFEYETNDSAASLDIDGVSNRAFCLNQAVVGVGQSATLNIGSTLIGNPFNVIATVPEALVAGSAGALMTAGGQFVNLNLAAPSLTFLFGGSFGAPLVTPFAGSLSVPISFSIPITAAAQMIILDAGSPDGISISSGVDFVVQ